VVRAFDGELEMPTFDWVAFEQAVCGALEGAVGAWATAHPEARVRAVALHGSTGEFDRSLSLPALAVALEDDGFTDDGTLWSCRFGPPDWVNAELQVDGALALEQRLTTEATCGDRDHFAAVETRYEQVLLSAVRHLAARLPELVSATPDAIAYWLTDRGLEVVRQTVPDALVERLFPKDVARQRLRERLAAAPPTERLPFYTAHLRSNPDFSWEEAQAGLIAAGAAALPYVLPLLEDDAQVAAGATVLARLGVATPDVITALRRRATGLWPATALGRLGDLDWLLTQPLLTAVWGLTAPYKAITQGPRLPPLDYRTLERLLTELPAAAALAEKELAPGHSPVRAQRGDEEALLRGLSSPYRVVRWHAVSLCGLRDLDPRVLPAVADRLVDEDATTRRLAVLTLRRWKAAAAPFAPRIAALANDVDPLVRRTVAG
jgi:hypothetical protein